MKKIITRLKNLFTMSKKDVWFELPCQNKDAPIVRYHYRGSSLIINKEDALERAIFVLNDGIKNWKEENQNQVP